MLAVKHPFSVALERQQAFQPGVPIQLPLKCWIVQDKTVRNPGMEGQTVRIMGEEMLIELPRVLQPQTQLKIQLQFCTAVHCFSAMYGIVIGNQENESKNSHRLHMTSIDSRDRHIMDQWVEAAS